MVVLCYLSLFISSYVVWWGLLMLVTMVGLMKLKMDMSVSSTMGHYFMVQELSGVFFVMGLSVNVMILSLIMKGGFAPFHYWMVKMVRNISWYSVVWFLTAQKMIYYFLIPLFLNFMWVVVMLVGSFISLYQGLGSRFLKMVVFVLLVSSGNMMLMVMVWDYMLGLFMNALYLTYLYIILSVDYLANYELFFVLMGMPGGLPFFLKLMGVYYLADEMSILVFLCMLLFFMNSLVSYSLVVINNMVFYSGKLFMLLFFNFAFIMMTML